MSREGKFALPLCAFVTLLASAPVHAGKFFNEFEILGQVGSEHYRWTDYNYLGDTVAKESGTTTSARISANNFFRSTNGIIYGAEIGSSDGHGDYYGDAWTGIVVPPANAATTIAGTNSGHSRVGIHGGYRYKTGPFGFNALAGVFSETWDRDIKNGTSTTGTLTYGHSESTLFSGFQLTGGVDLTLARFRVSLVAGPMFTNGTRTVTLNIPTAHDILDVDLTFKNAYFAALNSSLALDETGHHRIELTLYQTSFKTKPDSTPYVSARGTAYLQPGAETRSSGVQIGYGYTF
ncbi:MAG TPA: hypothetical protein DIC36_03700 [Gammaproteobacteria bacterium]|nr:hypothetical protein [Gammaproteobacteria bacterium]